MDVTKDDIRESREMILEEMRRCFDIAYRKQDQTNGRLLKLEETTARHDERIQTLAKDDASNEQTKVSEDKQALTRRDLTVAVAAIVSLIAVLAWLGRMPGVPH